MQDDIRDRYRTDRRDYTTVPLRAAASPAAALSQASAKKVKRFTNNRRLFSLLGLLIIVMVAAGAWIYFHRAASPVPKNIQKTVSFPIYYPSQRKLPPGYILNLSSFKSPISNGVYYTVDYGTGQKIAFSIQQKPANNILQGFYYNYIPLRNSVPTPIGQAQIGAHSGKSNPQTIASLTAGNVWIIATAPLNIEQAKFIQVLDALKK